MLKSFIFFWIFLQSVWALGSFEEENEYNPHLPSTKWKPLFKNGDVRPSFDLDTYRYRQSFEETLDLLLEVLQLEANDPLPLPLQESRLINTRSEFEISVETTYRLGKNIQKTKNQIIDEFQTRKDTLLEERWGIEIRIAAQADALKRFHIWGYRGWPFGKERWELILNEHQRNYQRALDKLRVYARILKHTPSEIMQAIEYHKLAFYEREHEDRLEVFANHMWNRIDGAKPIHNFKRAMYEEIRITRKLAEGPLNGSPK